MCLLMGIKTKRVAYPTRLCEKTFGIMTFVLNAWILMHLAEDVKAGLIKLLMIKSFINT